MLIVHGVSRFAEGGGQNSLTLRRDFARSFWLLFDAAVFAGIETSTILMSYTPDTVILVK